MKTKYCDWCTKEFDIKHFDQEGFCFIQGNIQAHYGDAVNKHRRENPEAQIYDSYRRKK